MNSGTLCILRDGQHETWSVWLCQGFDRRQYLERFEDRASAADFALREAARLGQDEGAEFLVHLPDDCPCQPEHERLLQVEIAKRATARD